MEQKLLKGKTALISGAGRNIGRQIALTFAREGADVILISRKLKDELDQVKKECESAGARALALLADVTKAEEVNGAVRRGLEQFGKIDVLINVLGIRPHKAFLDIDFEEWQLAFDVNCNSLFHLAKAVIPGMIERKHGSIVALAGQAAMRPQPYGTTVVSSKHAEYGLIKSLALEFGRYGIRANLVNPGHTKTIRRNPEWYSSVKGWEGGNPSTPDEIEKIPLHRIADPQEIANVVLFLASDMSSFVTGDRILAVGGGYIGN